MTEDINLVIYVRQMRIYSVSNLVFKKIAEEMSKTEKNQYK